MIHCWYPRFCGRHAARFEAEAFLPPGGRLVLDLSRVEQADAAGVLAIVRLARRVRATGGLLRVWVPADSVRSLLASAGLADLAEVYQTRDHAVAAARVG